MGAVKEKKEKKDKEDKKERKEKEDKKEKKEKAPSSPRGVRGRDDKKEKKEKKEKEKETAPGGHVVEEARGYAETEALLGAALAASDAGGGSDGAGDEAEDVPPRSITCQEGVRVEQPVTPLAAATGENGSAEAPPGDDADPDGGGARPDALDTPSPGPPHSTGTTDVLDTIERADSTWDREATPVEEAEDEAAPVMEAEPAAARAPPPPLRRTFSTATSVPGGDESAARLPRYDSRIVMRMAEEDVDWRGVLERFYMQHNPEKIGDVDQLLETYKGHEAKLYEAMVAKYLPPAPERSCVTIAPPAADGDDGETMNHTAALDGAPAPRRRQHTQPQPPQPDTPPAAAAAAPAATAPPSPSGFQKVFKSEVGGGGPRAVYPTASDVFVSGASPSPVRGIAPGARIPSTAMYPPPPRYTQTSSASSYTPPQYGSRSPSMSAHDVLPRYTPRTDPSLPPDSARASSLHDLPASTLQPHVPAAVQEPPRYTSVALPSEPVPAAGSVAGVSVSATPPPPPQDESSPPLVVVAHAADPTPPRAASPGRAIHIHMHCDGNGLMVTPEARGMRIAPAEEVPPPSISSKTQEEGSAAPEQHAVGKPAAPKGGGGVQLNRRTRSVRTTASPCYISPLRPRRGAGPAEPASPPQLLPRQGGGVHVARRAASRGAAGYSPEARGAQPAPRHIHSASPHPASPWRPAARSGSAEPARPKWNHNTFVRPKALEQNSWDMNAPRRSPGTLRRDPVTGRPVTACPPRGRDPSAEAPQVHTRRRSQEPHPYPRSASPAAQHLQGAVVHLQHAVASERSRNERLEAEVRELREALLHGVGAPQAAPQRRRMDALERELRGLGAEIRDLAARTPPRSSVGSRPSVPAPTSPLSDDEIFGAHRTLPGRVVLS